MEEGAGPSPLAAFISLRDHVGRCWNAARGLALQSQRRPAPENLQEWSPFRIQGFITEASTRLGASLKLLTQHTAPPLSAEGGHFACLSEGHSHSRSMGKHVFDIALSDEKMSQKLDGIPVYAVCNPASEFMLVSDSTNQKSLGIFCFRRSDAEALLEQVKAREPLAGKGAKVVAVSLNKVYKLNADGIAFRFLPDPQQVKNALQVRVQKEETRSFNGVPVFQSSNLVVRSNDTRYSPIFFCKEDLDTALQGALNLQQKVNPTVHMNTDIQVGSFESVVKRMEENKDGLGWEEVVFIPPGMTALGQIEGSRNTTVG